MFKTLMYLLENSDSRGIVKVCKIWQNPQTCVTLHVMLCCYVMLCSNAIELCQCGLSFITLYFTYNIKTIFNFGGTTQLD